MSKTYHTWCTGVHLPLHPLLSVLPILLGISEFPDNTQSSFEKKQESGWRRSNSFTKIPQMCSSAHTFRSDRGRRLVFTSMTTSLEVCDCPMLTPTLPVETFISCVDLEKRKRQTSVSSCISLVQSPYPSQSCCCRGNTERWYFFQGDTWMCHSYK